MTHDPADDVLKDLETALSVTPSPRFAEGVRARIAADSTRRRMSPVWAAVGLAAAAGIALMVITRQEAYPTAPPSNGSTPAVAEAQPVAPVVPRSAEPVAPRASAPHETRRVVPVQASAEPALEVISDQRDVLRRLWARVAPAPELKQVDARTAVATPDGDAPIVTEAVTAPVTITPVIVKPLGEGGERPEAPVIRNRDINAGRAR